MRLGRYELHLRAAPIRIALLASANFSADKSRMKNCREDAFDSASFR